MRQPRVQQRFLGQVWDHNAQPCRGIESQMRACGLHQGFDHHRLTGIGLLGAVVVVLDEDHGMLRRQGVVQPAVSHLHGWQALPVLGMKGNAVVRVDVAVEKGCDLGREAERFIQGCACEAEFQEVRKQGEVRAGAGQIAAAGLIPGVLQNGGHLPVVPHHEELPVIPQKRCRSQCFGQVHLRRLIHHDEVEIGVRPVKRPAPCGASCEEPVQSARRPPNDQQRLYEQLLPLLAGALIVVAIGQQHFHPCWHRLVEVVADFGNADVPEHVELPLIAMAGQELLQPPRHAVEHDTDCGMRLGCHCHPEGPHHTLQCPGSRQDGQAERVALACARRPLHHQHLLGVVAADNGTLRGGQPGGLLRLRGEVGKHLSSAEP